MTMYQHNDIPQDAQFDVIFLFTKAMQLQDMWNILKHTFMTIQLWFVR